MPGAAALTSEYAPRRFKSLFVNLIFAGVPTGAAFGGLLASRLIPLYGWQAAFWIAGAGPLVLALILLVVMPESVAYLAATKKRPAYIATMLGRFDRSQRYTLDDTFIVNERVERSSNQIGNLFREGRAAGTLLLWVIYFTGLFANAILVSWLPAIMTREGLSLQTGIMGPVLMNLGGIIGAILLGLMFNWAGAAMIIAGGLALTSIGAVLIGYMLTDATAALAVIFVTGMFLLGSLVSTSTLAAAFYPTKLRSTGIGWMFGIGRIGGAIGPALGGLLLNGGFSARTIFIMTGITTTLGAAASLAVGALYVAHRRSPRRRAPLPRPSPAH